MPTRDDQITVLFDAEAIRAKVEALARAIDRAYAGSRPVILVVLKGSFVFAADLVRRLTLPLEIEFVGVRSYGSGTVTTGAVEITHDVQRPLEGRDVIIVEDIVDTGLTLKFLRDHLDLQRPRSIRVCALLHKPSRSRVTSTIDFVGFEIPDRFVVGYGLDADERFRELPYIGFLATQDETP